MLGVCPLPTQRDPWRLLPLPALASLHLSTSIHRLMQFMVRPLFRLEEVGASIAEHFENLRISSLVTEISLLNLIFYENIYFHLHVLREVSSTLQNISFMANPHSWSERSVLASVAVCLCAPWEARRVLPHLFLEAVYIQSLASSNENQMAIISLTHRTSSVC